MTEKSGIDLTRAVTVKYINHRGEEGIRTIIPYSDGLYFGTSPYHQEKQWLLRCFDVDKKAERTYALRDVDWEGI